MIYLELKDYGERFKVGYQHNKPFDERHGLKKTEAELLETGLLVEMLPEQSTVDGKNAILCAKKDTKELYYEYVDSEATQIEQLRTDNLATMDALAEVYELILGGM